MKIIVSCQQFLLLLTTFCSRPIQGLWCSICMLFNAVWVYFLECLKRSIWPILWFRCWTRLLRKLSEIFISHFQTFQMVDKNQHLACMLSKSHEMANLPSLFSKPKNLKISKSSSVFRVLKPCIDFNLRWIWMYFHLL